jgi:hypothetical protein
MMVVIGGGSWMSLQQSLPSRRAVALAAGFEPSQVTAVRLRRTPSGKSMASRNRLAPGASRALRKKK